MKNIIIDGKPDFTWQFNLLKTIPHPCKYGNYGCKQAQMVQDLIDHEENCKYQKVYCCVKVKNLR